MHYIGAMPLPPPVADPCERLVTPVASADGSGRIDGCNSAFARWLGVSARRLHGLPLAALEADGDALQQALGRGEAMPEGPLHLRHVWLAFPGADARFADAWLSWHGAGWLLEAHPAEEFPGEDPLQALPSALTAALKGLAHELRNPLAGIKGAGQLLARRIRDPQSRELVDLVQAEVARLAGLVDELLAPTPSRPHAPLNIHAALERVLRLAEQEAGRSEEHTSEL